MLPWWPMVHDEGRTLEELTRGPWRDAARARLGVLIGGQGPDRPALAPIPAQSSGSGDGATSGRVEGPPAQRGVKREDGPVGAGRIDTPVVGEASTTYLEQDEALARLGFHKTSSWHRRVIEAIERARVRRVVLREGRRGGKTTTALRYFIDALVHRVWSIDPGDVGIVAIVSAQKWQSLDRITTARRYIEALYPDILVGRPRADRIDLQLPWGLASIRAFTCTHAGIVSGTMIGAILDELARWIDDRGRNPATEVIASLKPSLISTGGLLWLISSPWGEDDAHAKAFNMGNTEGQLVFHAPTWIANDGWITEEQTRLEEPDEWIWMREYAAIPAAGISPHWFNGLLLDRAVDAGRDVFEPLHIAAGGDLAFIRDAAAMVVNHADAHGVIGVRRAREWRPEGEPLEPDVISRTAMREALEFGAGAVMADQWAKANLIAAARTTGVAYRAAPQNGDEWAFGRRALGNGRFRLPSCATHCVCQVNGKSQGVCNRLVAQLRRVKVVNDSGKRLRAEHERRQGEHGDLADAWIRAGWQLRNIDTSSSMLAIPSRF